MKTVCPLSAWIALALLVAGGCQTTNQTTENRKGRVEVVIGTGGERGVYFPTGHNICRMVHKERKRHGIDCYARVTKGSVANLNSMRAGDIQMAIAQSDWHHRAYEGTSKFRAAGPDRDLRSVFSLYPETVTLIVRQKAGIRSIHDLKGKTVNIGRPGSGTEAYWHVLWSALGNTAGDLKRITQTATTDAVAALCDETIDAIFWIVSNPNFLTADTVNRCDAEVVDVSGPATDELINANGYLRHGRIPGGLYGSAPRNVTTFGVGATLVTTRHMPEDVVYEFVKAVFENLEEFKSLHSAYSTLSKDEMPRVSLTAPLHRGAVKYYREAGLM